MSMSFLLIYFYLTIPTKQNMLDYFISIKELKILKIKKNA